ncbi:MAG: hypothetical protein WA981_14440 [Glaciecola sp.]
MKNKNKFIQVALFAALATTVFVMSSHNSVNNTLTTSESCVLTNNKCTFSIDEQILRIEFSQTPIAEEELYIKFYTDSAWSVQNAFVQGINMYMGKTPVLFEKPDNFEDGVIFLGSCNLAEMHWQMTINLSNKKTANTKVLTVLFTTLQ